MMLIKTLGKISWWTWILGINIFLALATIFRNYQYFYPDTQILGPLGDVAALFNLSAEMNFAAWWTGICLLAAGLLAYEIFCVQPKRAGAAWLSIVVLMSGLAWDEIGSLHERIGSFSSLLPYGLGVVGLLTYALVKLFKYKETQRSALFILLGFTLFASVVFQEYLEHALAWPNWLQPIRFGIEESSELLGVFLCLNGMVVQRKEYCNTDSILAVIPNPSLMRLSRIVLVSLLVNICISIFYVPSLTDIPQRGNPAIFLPSALFFILFCDFVWKDRSLLQREKGKYSKIFASYFLICSALSVCYIFDKFEGKTDSALVTSFWFGLLSNFYFWYFIQILGVTLLLADRWRDESDGWKSKTFILLTLSLMLPIGMAASSVGLQLDLIVLSIFTCTVWMLTTMSPISVRKTDFLYFEEAG